MADLGAIGVEQSEELDADYLQTGNPLQNVIGNSQFVTELDSTAPVTKTIGIPIQG